MDLFLAVIKQAVVFARVANKFAFEERNVEDRGVIVDKLQQVNLERQTVFELGLSAQQLSFGEPESNAAVESVENQDAN